MYRTHEIRPRHRLLAALAAVCALSCTLAAPSVAATLQDSTSFSVKPGALAFGDVPALPSLGSIELDGMAQTTTAAMTPFTVVDATGSGSGWNLTVEGEPGAGRSAVFAQFCPQAKCGNDPEGYVAGGQTLPPGSLTLTTAGAGFAGRSGSTGTAPSLRCATACDVDSGGPVTVASAAREAGLGTWIATGFAPTSLALTTPSTLKPLPAGEVFRVDAVWSLTSGP